MTTYRRYRFTYDGVWGWDEGHDTVARVLQRRVDKYWWYTDPVVEGEAFKRLSFTFTVAGRDKWWCHRRAMDLAMTCYMAMSLSPRLVPVPTWEVLPPHRNRGRSRVPKDTQPAPA